MISVSSASVKEINALNWEPFLFFLQDYLKKKGSTLFKFKSKTAAYFIIKYQRNVKIKVQVKVQAR